jgi:hypothetical protein
MRRDARAEHAARDPMRAPHHRPLTAPASCARHSKHDTHQFDTPSARVLLEASRPESARHCARMAGQFLGPQPPLGGKWTRSRSVYVEFSSARFCSAAATLSAAHVSKPIPCTLQPAGGHRTLLVIHTSARGTPRAASAAAMPVWFDPRGQYPHVPSASSSRVPCRDVAEARGESAASAISVLFY